MKGLNKIFIIVVMVSMLLGSLIPVNAVVPTTQQVNDYSTQIAEFVKDKCHGNCQNVLLLGDDYVIPSFRRDIRWTTGAWFWEDVSVDYILTDIGYVQRETKTFDKFDDLFKLKRDDVSYQGKDVLIIKPDNPTAAQSAEIERFKQVLINKGYKPDFEERFGSSVSCNDPGLFSDYNGRTIFLFGTEENNYAYNCFPFQAGLENRDTAFIDINPWDGRNYAVIVNSNDPNVMWAFTKVIEDNGYQNLRSESAYFISIGTEVAGYIVLGVSVAALVVGTGGIAAPALLAGGWAATEAAVDGASVIDTCFINPQGAGWCIGTAALSILPGAVGPEKKALKRLAKEGEEILEDVKPVKNLIEEEFPALRKLNTKELIKTQKNGNDLVQLAKGSKRFFKETLSEADKLSKLKKIPFNDAERFRFLKSVGKYEDELKTSEDYFKKIEFSDKVPDGVLGRYDRSSKIIQISDKVDPIKAREFILPHEIGHAKVNKVLGISETEDILSKVDGFRYDITTPTTIYTRGFDDFATDKLIINSLSDNTKFIEYSKSRLKNVIGDNSLSAYGMPDLIQFKAEALEFGDQQLVSNIDNVVNSKFAGYKNLFNQNDASSLLSRYKIATDVYPGINKDSYLNTMNSMIQELNDLR